MSLYSTLSLDLVANFAIASYTYSQLLRSALVNMATRFCELREPLLDKLPV